MTEQYAAMRWPWHLKLTRTNGVVVENDYADDFDAPGYAQWASGREGVARVELSVTFVDGQPVSPAASASAA